MELYNNQIIFLVIKIFLVAISLDAFNHFFMYEKMNQMNENINQKTENLNNTQNQQPSGIIKEDIQIPEQKFMGNSENIRSQQMIAVDVFLCQSCGFNQEFNKLKEYLEMRYPNVVVNSNPYPVKSSKKLLAKIISLLQWAIIACIFFGAQIFAKIGQPLPQALQNLDLKKKMIYMFLIFQLGGFISGMLTNTGAFEVYFNNSLIYSKLQQGSFPEPFLIENTVMSFFNTN